MRSIPQTSRSGSDLTAAGGHKGGIVCGGAKPNWNGPRCTPGSAGPFPGHVHSSGVWGSGASAACSPSNQFFFPCPGDVPRAVYGGRPTKAAGERKHPLVLFRPNCSARAAPAGTRLVSKPCHRVVWCVVRVDPASFHH